MKLFYGGEDDVTKRIARRLAFEIANKVNAADIILEDIGIRERGSAIRKKLPQIVALGKKYPIIFVFDSDGECILEILKKECTVGWDNTFTSLNIAIDEGESWLLADKANFARYFGINVSDIGDSSKVDEMTFPYKTSLYIMKELIPTSVKKEVREKLTCTAKGKKPPTYNDLWVEYIDSKWNIEEAMKKSESLYRAVRRIKKKLECYIKSK